MAQTELCHRKPASLTGRRPRARTLRWPRGSPGQAVQPHRQQWPSPLPHSDPEEQPRWKGLPSAHTSACVACWSKVGKVRPRLRGHSQGRRLHSGECQTWDSQAACCRSVFFPTTPVVPGLFTAMELFPQMPAPNGSLGYKATLVGTWGEAGPGKQGRTHRAGPTSTWSLKR